MTERRFTLDAEENGLCRCILVDGEEMPTCEICELLNELNDENEQLKEENEKLIQKKCLPCELVRLQTREIDKLKKENEQLKQKLENIGLNEKNDSIKMIDGKVFIRM